MSRENAYVAGQAIALAGLAWPGPPRWTLPRPVRLAGAALVAAGVALQVSGAVALGPDLTATPRPRSRATLRSRGPYAVVRHPIYAGLLLMASGAAIVRQRPEPVAALAALATVVHLKVSYEETLLKERYGAAYELYAHQVPRLIPRLPSRF